MNFCPACGFTLDKPAYDHRGVGSQDICACCGIQYGYSDAVGGRNDLRSGFWLGWGARWYSEGAPFSAPYAPPAGWDPEAQWLAHLGRSLDWPDRSEKS